MPKVDLATNATLVQRYANPQNGGKILVVSHEWPDGDAVGSAVAMWHLLNKNGYEADLYLPDVLPDYYRSFLPYCRVVPKSDSINIDYTLLVCVDASNEKRIDLGEVNIHQLTIPIVIFDHHPDADEYFGIGSCIMPEASSASEIIWKYAKMQKWQWDEYAATSLLLGIITDTGCFRFSNTTPDTMRAAADLLEAGADQERIIREIYFSKPRNLLFFENELFHNIKFAYDGKFAWVNVTRELLDKYSVNLKETEQLIEVIRSIKDVVVAAIIKPTSNPSIFKVSLRSKDKTISVGRIARALKGGGHEMAAGCSIIAKTKEYAEQALCRNVRRELFHENLTEKNHHE